MQDDTDRDAAGWSPGPPPGRRGATALGVLVGLVGLHALLSRWLDPGVNLVLVTTNLVVALLGLHHARARAAGRFVLLPAGYLFLLVVVWLGGRAPLMFGLLAVVFAAAFGIPALAGVVLLFAASFYLLTPYAMPAFLLLTLLWLGLTTAGRREPFESLSWTARPAVCAGTVADGRPRMHGDLATAGRTEMPRTLRMRDRNVLALLSSAVLQSCAPVPPGDLSPDPVADTRAASICSTTGSSPWSGFMGGPHHTGESGVDLPGADPGFEWAFSPGDHVWSYEHGAGPWSAAVGAVQRPDGTLVLAGSHDHNLYAVRAANGEEAWRFTTGGRIDASPAVVDIGTRTLAIVASADRSIYGLDADSGDRIWRHEVHPWYYTVPPAEMGSPCTVEVDGSWIVLCTAWINDHRPFANVQRGEMLAFDAATGDLRWRREISTTPLSAPAAARTGDGVLAFAASEDGRVQALDVRSGELLWSHAVHAPVHSSPTFCPAPAGGTPIDRVLIGDDYGTVSCLDASGGDVLWTYRAGHAVHSTPALVCVGGRHLCVFGSFDRRIHAVDLVRGERAWSFETGDMVRSSPLAVTVRGRPAVVVYSMDRYAYLLDASGGDLLGRFETGGYLWPLYTRGESVGSMPAAMMDGGGPIVVLPGDDGVIHGMGWSPAAEGR